MKLEPHVENARNSALDALKKSNKGGGLKGWTIRRVISWFRRRLKRPGDLEEIARISEVLISILNYLKGTKWLNNRHNETLETALRALQELRSATVGR